ncbi:hypothetical protein FK535_11875 [Mycolicibacterium sp. 018/SC-01/001]|uniref:hypothetical protein n=1 Tax=Mycolicibacterium sp. 018/SC-01/001 TaxID=2592069 RepID=UPI00117E2465|nr:hypothetical protein [Mycolicibacterium sp. 018/SC-01/001]TRW83344.1 hypothetical protein FK535_11875 [Mycolicibacterium sp. 018/SC-01/001]
MKIHNDAGVWTTGSAPPAPPLTAVLEVAGAVLSWPVDDAEAGPQIAFTDVGRAEWLWRVVGPDGHGAVVTALLDGDADAGNDTVDLPGVDLEPTSLSALRRLAFGHWLRRWWPASRQDGIADLDMALLDGEVAVLTEAMQEFFDADAFDADVADLLAPHAPLFGVLARHDDSRIAGLAQACLALAEDIGVAVDEPATVERRRDDYALAAGPGSRTGRPGEAIAEGRDSVRWSAVPPGVFDAAENTVAWSVESIGTTVAALMRTEVWGAASPEGIPVRFSSGAYAGTGALDATGAATVPLFDGADPLSEDVAWDHDWRDVTVTVGAEADESASARDRVRALARSRLTVTGADAFLAERLAADADY